MGYFDGLSFFFFLGILLLLALALGFWEKPLGPFGLIASCLTALFCFWGKPLEGAYLLFYVLYSFILVQGYALVRKKWGRVRGPYLLFLGLSLLPLLLHKGAPLFGKSLFAFTGISYLCFRVIGIIIDLYDGVCEGMRADAFLAFLLFFPSFSSGPVDKRGRFEKDYQRVLPREEYGELASKGLLFLLWGAAYKFILSAYAYRMMGYLDTPEARWFHWVGYAYAYSLYLFFDFAGYSKMAVGVAYCLGVELPDNFHLPFLAEDMRDFWNRWHISLSHWFRDYVFTRFIMLSTKKKWFKTRLNRAAVGFLVDMGLMGAWHGLTPSYLAYGLYHGLLLAGTEVYQKKSGFYKKNKGKKWYRALSWFVTVHLVVFGFFLFSGKLLG